MKRKSKFRIPGLSFSWKRAVGISGVKTRIARKTGIPLTRGGLARKIGETFLRLFMVFAVSLVITPTFADRRYYCANCGREYNSIRDLTANSCHRHPAGANKGKHVLFEGSVSCGVICKYCGREYADMRNLTANYCHRHPSGPNKGKHSAFEGGVRLEYNCKYCGRTYKNLRDLTVNLCHRHPLGSNKGKHSPAR